MATASGIESLCAEDVIPKAINSPCDPGLLVAELYKFSPLENPVQRCRLQQFDAHLAKFAQPLDILRAQDQSLCHPQSPIA